jgi:hypothetical protein
MDVKADLPIYLDSTMMSTFRSCPKKFYREFVLGLRPVGLSVDLHAGGCFAAGLETFYDGYYIGGKSTESALMLAYRRFLAEWGDFESVKDTPKSKDRVWEAIADPQEGYIATYPPSTDKVQPYRVDGKPTMEFTFAVPLEPIGDRETGFPLHPVTGEPFLYSGRFDMLGEMGNRPVVRDEKTTKSIAHNWSSQWDLRGQFSGYCWACQKHGLPVDTVVIRGIGILKTKFHQVEAIKIYDEHNIARWHEQLRRDTWRLVDMWNTEWWDYNLAESCSSYGGCAFLDLCNSKQEELWYPNYTIRRWNPLQKNPIKMLEAA